MTATAQVHRDPLVSPAAKRHRVSAWRDPRLVVGIVLVAASALLGGVLLGGSGGTVGVWATPEALVEGQPVTAADLVRRDVGFADPADAGRYLRAEDPLPEGLVLTRGVGAGELLPRAALADAADEASLDVPLSVPAGAVPSTVTAGARVDVWVTPDRDGVAADRDVESVLVLDDVRVVELPRTGGLGAGGDRQVVVALDATREEVLPAALARIARGSVVLVRAP